MPDSASNDRQYRPPRPYRFAKRAAHGLLKYLYSAPTTTDFLNAGYILFGIQLAAIGSFLFVADPFSAWSLLSAKLPHILTFVLWLAGKSPPPTWTTNPTIDIVLLYLAAGLIPRTRHALGKLAIAITLRLTAAAIKLGEVLLKRRTLALSCVIALLTSLVLGLTALYFVYKKRSDGAIAYENWLSDTERFLSEATLVHQERSKYAPVADSWESIPRNYRPLDSDHPAIVLNATLASLYSEPLSNPQLWMSKLRAETTRLSKLAVLDDALANSNPQTGREWSLLFAFLGRAYMSEVGDSCRADERLSRAYSYYTAVRSSELRRSSANGLGTLLACRLVLYLQAHGSDSAAAVPQWEPSACASSLLCLEEAKAKYELAAAESGACSFADKRRRNNVLDLYLKLGNHFESARATLRAYPWASDLSTPETFSASVRAHLADLLECWGGDFVPVIFLSAAQAYGVIATVLPVGADERQDAVRSAAHYLRLALSWIPATTLESSDFRYFCAAVEDDRLHDDFIASFQAALPGLERNSFDDVEDKIGYACGEIDD